jgi:hypothetical protein
MDTDRVREVFKVDGQIIADIEVEKTVAVKVCESGGGAPTRVSDTRPLGDVGEGSVAVVAIELVRAEIGELDVGETVVIDVSEGDTHPPPAVGQAGLFGHVLEGSVPAVSKQRSVKVFSFSESVNGGSLDDVDVHQSIVVKIERTDTTPLGLRDVIFMKGITVDVDEVQTRSLGNIREVGDPMIRVGVRKAKAANEEGSRQRFQASPRPLAQSSISVVLIIERE